MRDLIVDNFAGGGGASTGIEMAIGRPVDIAINEARFSRGRGLGGIKWKAGLRETRRRERGSANTF
jgi:hypothetical protein